MKACGCHHSPIQIYWGSKVGSVCQRGYPSVGHPVPYDDATCQNACTDPHGEQLILFCPDGWEHNCKHGCIPPEFTNSASRMDFWELTLTSLLLEGNDYIPVQEKYLKMCRCKENIVRPIRFGTEIGHYCEATDEDP